MEQITTTTENAQATNINTGALQNVAEAAVELFNGAEVIFSVVNNHSASLNAQITDNYVESNFAIQDHIAFSPITVTLSGIVGENVLTSEASIQQAQDELEQAKNRQRLSGDFFNLSNYIENRGEGLDLTTGFSSSMITTKLGVIGSIIPPLSNYTQMAVNAIGYVYDAANSFLTNKWANANNAILNNARVKSGEPTALQKAYEQIKNTFYGRKPSKVYTPWATYEDMYIQSIEVSQDELNNIIDLTVTFKQLKFSKVEYGKVNEQVRAAYCAASTAEEQNGGKNRSMLLDLGDAGNTFIKNGVNQLAGVIK